MPQSLKEKFGWIKPSKVTQKQYHAKVTSVFNPVARCNDRVHKKMKKLKKQRKQKPKKVKKKAVINKVPEPKQQNKSRKKTVRFSLQPLNKAPVIPIKNKAPVVPIKNTFIGKEYGRGKAVISHNQNVLQVIKEMETV